MKMFLAFFAGPILGFLAFLVLAWRAATKTRAEQAAAAAADREKRPRRRNDFQPSTGKGDA